MLSLPPLYRPSFASLLSRSTSSRGGTAPGAAVRSVLVMVEQQNHKQTVPLYAVSRDLSTAKVWPDDANLSPARAKLRHVLEEYRQKNFSQTLFSRFVKEMIHATDANHDGKISQAELCKLLDNIGAKDQLSQQEVQSIMDELGQMDEDLHEKLIHIDNVEDMILQQHQ